MFSCPYPRIQFSPHFQFLSLHKNMLKTLFVGNKGKVRISKRKLRLDKMHHISEEDFRLINWLPTSKRVDQCINTITFKFVNNTCPYYLKEMFEFAPHCRIDTRNKFPKLKIPFGKTNPFRKTKHGTVSYFISWSFSMEQFT